MKLEDKVAVVTGAGRGIGRAIALAFAREGADLVLAARTMTELEETAGGVRALGRNALAVKCDVSRRGDVTAMVGTALERFGRVDILVNNAGRITPLGPLVDSDSEEWLATISVNLGGVFRCCQAVLPIMRQQRAGKIINLSGGGATSASPYFSAYGASKTAVIRLTETLAEELKEYNIHATALWPKTVIESYATINFKMGEPSLWRKADIVADATFEVLQHPEKANGRALIDEDFLREIGYTDFDQYKCVEDGEPLELSSPVMSAARS